MTTLKLNSFIKECVLGEKCDILKPCLVWAIEQNIESIPHGIATQALKQDSPSIFEMMFCVSKLYNVLCNLWVNMLLYYMFPFQTDYDLSSYETSTKKTIIEQALEKNSSFNVIRFLLMNLRNRVLMTTNVSKYKKTLNQILIKSVQNDDLPLTATLLQLGVESNVEMKNGQTVLFKACSANHARIAQKLVESGADVNHRDRRGWTPLMEACIQGRYESVQVCLSAGGDITARNHNGTTALLAACSKKDNIQVVNLLLQHKARLDEQDNAGRNALIALAESKSYYCLRDLICQWKYPIDDVTFQHVKRIYSVESYIVTHEFFEHPYITKHMTYDQVLSMMKIAVATKITYYNSDIHDAFMNYPLIKSDVDELIDIAVKAQQNPLDPEEEVFDLEYFDKQKSDVQESVQPVKVQENPFIVGLVKKGFELDMQKYSLLDVVKFGLPSDNLHSLIEECSDLNQTDRDLNTALHLLVDKQYSSVELLLTKGANPNVKNNKGHTPLHGCQNPKFAHLLCKHSALVDVEDATGLSPWKNAILFDKANLLSVFIDCKVARDEYITDDVLLQCIENKCWENVHILLQKIPGWLYDVETRKKVCNTVLQNTKVTLLKYLIDQMRSIRDENTINFFISEYEANGCKDDINVCSSSGMSLLMYVCSLDLVNMADKLIAIGASVETCDMYGHNVLFYCVSTQSIQLILSQGLSVNTGSQDHNVYELLHFFATKHNYACMRALLEAGADPNVRNQNGRRLVFNLLYHDDIRSISGQAIALLVEFGCDLNIRDAKNGDTVFLYACRKEIHYNVCETLLGTNRSLVTQRDSKNYTPLHIALETKNKELMTLLLQYDAEVNCKPSILKVALNHNDMEFMDAIKLLIEKGADPEDKNNFGESLLLLACQSGHEIYKKLAFNPDLVSNSTDEFGRTVVHLAFGNMPHLIPYVVAYLGQMIEKADFFGRTVLHVWRPHNKHDVELVSHWKQNITNINQADFNGHTALHLAYLDRNPEVRNHKVDFLLNLGADDRNVKDKSGLTPQKINILVNEKPRENEMSVFASVFNDDIQLSFHNEAHRAFAPWCQELHHVMTNDDIHEECIERMCTYLLCTWSEDKLSELREKAKTVLSLFTDIGELMGKREPLLYFEPKLSGSCREGTKVGAPDEMDILCIFRNWKLGMIHEGSACASFVELWNNDIECCVHPFICKEKKISRIVLFEHFYYHLGQVLQSRDIWVKYPHIKLIDTYDVSHSARSITSLKLVWCGKLFSFQELDVDVVPTFNGTNDLPSNCCKHELLNRFGYFVIPKFTISTVRSKDPNYQFQLSFNMAEAALFGIMPTELKQGYMLAKVVKGMCPRIDYLPAGDLVTSYMLKTCAFHEFKSHREYQSRIDRFRTGKMSFDPQPYLHVELCPKGQVVYYAQKIFARLQIAMQNQVLNAFFLPGYNILGHKTYRENFRPGLLVQICKTMLIDPNKQSDIWSELIHYKPIELPEAHAPELGKLL